MEGSSSTFLKPVPLAMLWCDSTYADTLSDEDEGPQQAGVGEVDVTDWMLKVAPSEIVRSMSSYLRVDDVVCLAMTSFPLWSAYRLQADDYNAPFPFHAVIRSIRRAKANQKDELVDAIAALGRIEKVPSVEQRIWLLMELARHRPGIQRGDNDRIDSTWSAMAEKVAREWFALDAIGVSLKTRQDWMVAQWHAAMPPRFSRYVLTEQECAIREIWRANGSDRVYSAFPSPNLTAAATDAACTRMRDLPMGRWPEAFAALEARAARPRDADLIVFMQAFDGAMPPVSPYIASHIERLRNVIDIGDEW